MRQSDADECENLQTRSKGGNARRIVSVLILRQEGPAAFIQETKDPRINKILKKPT